MSAIYTLNMDWDECIMLVEGFIEIPDVMAEVRPDTQLALYCELVRTGEIHQHKDMYHLNGIRKATHVLSVIESKVVYPINES